MNTKLSKYFEKMQYNFKDIADIKPYGKENTFDFTNSIRDSVAHDFNPKRYNFYIQFMEALNNPDTLNNVLYANTVIKSKKETESENIRKIVNGLQSLYAINPNNKLTGQQYLTKKKQQIEKINTNVTKRIQNLFNDDISKSQNKDSINAVITDTFKDSTQSGGVKLEFVGDNKKGAEEGAEESADILKKDSNASIMGLFYNKIVADVKQITDNLNTIQHKFININKKINNRKSLDTQTIDDKTKRFIIDKSESSDPNTNKLASLLKDALYSENTSKFKRSINSPLSTFTESVEKIIKNKLESPLGEGEGEGEEVGVGVDVDVGEGDGDGVYHQDGENNTIKGFKTFLRTNHDFNKRGSLLSNTGRRGENTHQRGGYILDDNEYNKLNDAIFEIENDIMHPISKLDISNEDRFIFIGVTFIIRFISLSLIEWSMNTNFISSFEQAFLFYCVIYISIFCFITIIVNIIYNYPLQQLYTDRSIVNISSMLYYFYIYTNGPMRLVLHLIFIIILMLIPFIINLGNNKQSDAANFNYELKKTTRNTLSRFTLVIWIITSIIALRY